VGGLGKKNDFESTKGGTNLDNRFQSKRTEGLKSAVKKRVGKGVVIRCICTDSHSEKGGAPLCKKRGNGAREEKYRE